GSGVVESEPESASESDPESEPELEPEPARLGGEDGARAPEDGVRGVVDGGAGLVLSSAASAELSCAGSSGRESGSANQPVTSRPSSDSARAVPAAVPASIPRWRRASWTTACTRWRPLLESRPSRLIRVQVSVETSRRAPSRRPYGRAGHRLRIPPAPSEGNTPTARHAAPSSRLCARSSPISRPRPRSTSAMIPGSHSARRWYEPVMGYSRAGKWVNRRNRERRRGWVNRRNRGRRGGRGEPGAGGGLGDPEEPGAWAGLGEPEEPDQGCSPGVSVGYLPWEPAGSGRAGPPRASSGQEAARSARASAVAVRSASVGS